MNPDLEYWLALAVLPASILLLISISVAWEMGQAIYHRYRAKRAPFWWDVPAEDGDVPSPNK